MFDLFSDRFRLKTTMSEIIWDDIVPHAPLGGFSLGYVHHVTLIEAQKYAGQLIGFQLPLKVKYFFLRCLS
jgi:hypothetical protein